MPTVTTPIQIKLQNILFATDLSPLDDAIVSRAVELARRYGATLYTVHVLPHTPFVESPSPDPEQTRAKAEQQLAVLLHTASLKNVKHRELIEQGEVKDVVSALVLKYGIDLIVIGTGGRKGAGKLLLGSVAEQIFRTARCPVLTIGPHVTRWAINGPLKHILFATDFGPESMHALPYAMSLAEENRADLTLLHVAPEPGVSLPEPEPGTMPTFEKEQVAASIENQLRSLIPEDTHLSREPQYMARFGTPAGKIMETAAKMSDLIVLGVKRPAALTKHLGEGVAYQVACDAPCAVLSVGVW